MKRLLALAALSPLMAVAQTIENDTLVIDQPQEIVIVKRNHEMVIEVRGEKNDPNYRYQLKMGQEMSTYTHEVVSNWSFTLPFNKQSRCTRSGLDISPSFAFGFVNAVNADPGVEVAMGSSYELSINDLITCDYSPWHNGSTFSVGFGLNWRNFRMTGRTRFIKQGSDILLGSYPEGVNTDFSRIKVFSMTVPFYYSYCVTGDLSFSLGPVVNFNTYASLKTRYKEEGRKVKEFDKHIRQSPVTVDLMAVVRFSVLGWYVKYSPVPVLQSDFGPQFNGFSTGTMIGF